MCQDSVNFLDKENETRQAPSTRDRMHEAETLPQST